MDQDISRPHIAELDGIRGLACLMVLIHHYVTAVIVLPEGTIISYVAKIFAPLFVSGVDLFFVLSGFLIGGILIDHRESKSFFKSFYIRRICRIFPVYYFLYFLFVLISLFELASVFPQLNLWLFNNPMPLWSYALFVQNFYMAQQGTAGAKFIAITWSLAVEEQYYLLFPFVVRYFNLKTVLWIAIASILLAPICRYLVSPFGFFASYALLPCRIDTLLVGFIVAYIVRKPEIMEYMTKKQSILYLSAALLFLLLVIAEFGILSSATLKYSFLAIFYGILILTTFIRTSSMMNLILRFKFLTFTGSISYAFYLFHQAINGLMHGFILNQPPTIESSLDIAVTMSSVILTFIFSYISFFLLESPIRQWGKRYTYI